MATERKGVLQKKELIASIHNAQDRILQEQSSSHLKLVDSNYGCDDTVYRSFLNDISKHKKCSRCKKVKYVVRRSKSGKPICGNCCARDHWHDTSKHEECLWCEKMKPVATRDKSGKPICHVCYHKKRNIK